MINSAVIIDFIKTFQNKEKNNLWGLLIQKNLKKNYLLVKIARSKLFDEEYLFWCIVWPNQTTNNLLENIIKIDGWLQA